MSPLLDEGHAYGGSDPVVSGTKTDAGKQTARALPASWYTSAEMYELERRSIFSKKWLFVTHQLRLREPGQWLRYGVAGFEFILCRDRQGKINAFHNICRHRAFPLVVEDQGRSSIFACKYHGWSYGLNGNLAKAPKYQDIPDFDKASNSLLPIHVHIDNLGFIWVNLDGQKTPENSWDDDFKDIYNQPRFNGYNYDDYIFDHAWDMVGDFNWKLLADNYNECYHCFTAHPDSGSLADLNAYDVAGQKGSIMHFSNIDEEKVKLGLRICSTFFFPNASMTVSPNFFFTQRVVPISVKQSVLKYEVYRHKDAKEEDFKEIDSIFKRIMAEDKWLCNLTQKNISGGVFVNGELHPHREKGPLHVQQTFREIVRAHHAQEVEQGKEIWPARQITPKHARVSDDDVQFCTSLGKCTVSEAIEF